MPTAQLLLLVLVFVRTAGIVVVAPILGTNEVPAVARALIAFTLAALVWPTQMAAAPPLPGTLLDLGLIVIAESLIGVVLGLGLMLLLAAFQLTGHILGQLGGMSIGDVFNPGFDADLPLISQFLYLVTLAVYAMIGGHRLLVSGLLDTFAAVPPGTAVLPEGASLMVTLLTESFDLGIRAAAPAIVAQLCATVVLGLISRSLPQLNILALGFGFNALVTFGVLSVTVGGACWLLQEQLEPFFHTALAALTGG